MADIRYVHNVGLWFHPADVPKLRELASPAWTRRPEDRSLFQKAANVTEKKERLVIQVMSADKLAQIVGVFANRGMHQPLVEDLNLAPAPRGGRISRDWSR